MPRKAQREARYAPIPAFLRRLREEAGMSQRDLGASVSKPQSWVYNCESGERRVDIAEFVDWAKACDVDPVVALRRFLTPR